MRAGTMTPSDAGMRTIRGASQGYDRNCAVVDVVSCASWAPGVLRARYSSGGLFEYECTSAIQAPSGDSTVACEPSCGVTFTRAPPFTLSRYSCASNGELSLVVRKKVRRSGERSTLSTSQRPLVSCRLSLPSPFIEYRCAKPSASEVNQTRFPSSQPAAVPHAFTPPQLDSTQAVSRSTSMVVSRPAASTRWMNRVL